MGEGHCDGLPKSTNWTVSATCPAVDSPVPPGRSAMRLVDQRLGNGEVYSCPSQLPPSAASTCIISPNDPYRLPEELRGRGQQCAHQCHSGCRAPLPEPDIPQSSNAARTKGQRAASFSEARGSPQGLTWGLLYCRKFLPVPAGGKMTSIAGWTPKSRTDIWAH